METQIITAIGTVVGIACTLILRDWRDGKNLFKWNAAQGTFAQGTYMKEHYNDSLTSLLTEIQVGQQEIVETLRDIQRNGVRIKK